MAAKVRWLKNAWWLVTFEGRTLGHENEAVAAAHYDRLDFTTYSEPERLQPGETPMDLFARLCRAPEAQNSHHQSHHLHSARRNPPKRQGARWRPQRESNPCRRLERAVS